jgi:uncharacterized protein (DUF305 family)
MKKLILSTAGILMLVSVTAYAQMHQRHSPDQSVQGTKHGGTMHRGTMHGGMMHGSMHAQMHDQMHEKMKAKMQGKATAAPQGGHDSHGAHATDGPQGDRSASSLAFHGINQKMHEGMNIAFTGNADVDFANGMIPHHQGAVEMAKVVLAFGKDPEIRKLAEAIIHAQESEIAMMRAWLTRNAK